MNTCFHLEKNTVSLTNLWEFCLWREFSSFPSHWSLGKESSESISMSIADCVVAYCVVCLAVGITWKLLSLILFIQKLFLSGFRFHCKYSQEHQQYFSSNFKAHYETLHFFLFFFFLLLGGGGAEGKKRENFKQVPHPVLNLTWGSISQLQDHDLSRYQESGT